MSLRDKIKVQWSYNSCCKDLCEDDDDEEIGESSHIELLGFVEIKRQRCNLCLLQKSERGVTKLKSQHRGKNISIILKT